MQTAINNIVETYGVVMVAAAGNHNAFEIYAEDDSGNSILIDHTETPISYDYPASLDHVISVSGVNHWYTMDAYPNTDYDEVLGTYYRYIEDSVSPYVNNPTNSMSPYGIYINPWIFEVGFAMLTLNENVDILAPGYQLLSYSKMAYDCIDAPNPDINTNLLNGKYTSSTSQATPYVTGTIGLMFTVDECLTPTEVESILKLTAKDIESNPMNVPFAGYIGAGKLETGNAVEFVNEMNKTDGVAVIKDHLFYRFNFAINRFQNHLTLDNVAFVEDASVTFKAKNTIELIKNVTLIPNSNSFIDLEIDSKIDKVCNYTPPIPPDSEPTNPNPTTPTDSNNGTPTDHDVRLSPNPTRAVFSIELDYDDDEVVEVILHNAMGQQVLHVILNEQENINVTHLDTGIYSVKIFTLHNHIFSKQLIKF
jgi:subtilisin family serine protease